MRAQPITILAIDPGTQRAGYCVGHGDDHVASGTIELAGDNPWVRIMDLNTVLFELAARYMPNVVACEEPRGDHGNKHADGVLWAAFGQAVAVTARGAARFVAVNPASVKATGFCKDNPGRVASLVGVSRAKLKQEPDRCDAIGVWQAALCWLQEQRLERATEGHNRR